MKDTLLSYRKGSRLDMDEKDLLVGNDKEMTGQELGIYVHIPFCIKKCDYCDFLSAPATENAKKAYVDALLTEIDSYIGRVDDYTVSTIFFGGGTPSCLEAEDIRRIMERLERVFHFRMDNLEATIEVNPGTVTDRKLMIYHDAGFNRLSFGLQSADNKELKLLGRIHTYEQFLDNYLMAREIGFQNINIDLMSALPSQSVDSWKRTLKTVMALQPEHISAYSLIIEEGTKFYEHYREGGDRFSELPDEDTDREIYHRTKNILEAGGYHRYEISNYAKPGFECRHNISYWIGTEYLGIGLGASSLLNSARFSNLHTIERYISLCTEYKKRHILTEKQRKSDTLIPDILQDLIGIRQDCEKLSVSEKMEEFMFLGLRMCGGISRKTFYNRFHMDIDSVYKDQLKQLADEGLLALSGDNIRLTEYGIDISNYVFSVFLLN